jgi:dTDP-4-amino-4,6-dideoxygalactose transaminase
MVMSELARRGVGTQVHYIPLYRQPYHQKLGVPSQFPGAERYYAGCLSIPIHPSLTDEDVERVVSAVNEVVGA